MPKVTIRYDAVAECDLDLKAVEKYLKSREWCYASSCKYGLFFESAEYGETVALPTTDRIDDFNARVADLFRTLAQCEKRPVPEILADMQ